ncbi:hypothetical protein [Paludisphaera sp.]|uniref:hypothetical protein n=1 Tax=Paludisphaera sp. TaxID=2017432 RepID=UPI00301E1CC6
MAEDIHAEPVLLCSAANEIEATLIVNLLTDGGIPAHTDATQASGVFGGLPFESGHGVYIQPQHARQALAILSQYPQFEELKNVHAPTSD